MSDAPDRDLFAAEYVMGTLEGEEAAEAARLLATDGAFAASVRAWEERLTPLAGAVASRAVPAGLWERIARTTAAQAGPVLAVRRLRFWRASTAVGFALAAALAAFIVLRPPPPPPPPRVAVLAPASGGVPVLLATADAAGILTVRPNGTIVVPADRDLELWELPQGATQPRSLGVLPAEGRRLTAALGAGTQLLVSLEPRGGSPTGQPTGPVVYGGRLAAE